MMAARLATLLSEPFGPYSDDEILVPNVCRNEFTIQDLTMELNGSPIGLNDTEFVVAPPPNHPTVKHPVYFYGTLEIESLDWLTEIGKARVERDLRRRDERKKSGPSTLTLRSVYGNRKGEGSRVTVRIQGKKNMLVRFLVPPNINSMTIFSLRENSALGQFLTRRYVVESLRSDFWKAGHAYMHRCYLWALIKRLIETDPKKTPVKRRTIDWIVQGFLTRIRPEDEYRRIIFHPRNLDGDEITDERRHLRSVTAQEVRGWYAGIAEYILAQLLASTSASTRILNVKKWIQWCYDVKAGRKRAKRDGVLWGFPPGMEQDLVWLKKGIDLTPYGGTKDLWQTKITNALKKKPAKKTKQPTRMTKAQARTPLAPVGEHDPRFKKPRPPRFRYDADFSEESTAGETDSEQEEGRKINYTAPRFCATRPQIPAGRFEWNCASCDFKLDMFQLAKGFNRRSANSTLKLANDVQLRKYFEDKVSEHYSLVHVERRVVEKTRETDDVIKMEID